MVDPVASLQTALQNTHVASLAAPRNTLPGGIDPSPLIAYAQGEVAFVLATAGGGSHNLPDLGPLEQSVISAVNAYTALVLGIVNGVNPQPLITYAEGEVAYARGLLPTTATVYALYGQIAPITQGLTATVLNDVQGVVDTVKGIVGTVSVSDITGTVIAAANYYTAVVLNATNNLLYNTVYPLQDTVTGVVYSYEARALAAARDAVANAPGTVATYEALALSTAQGLLDTAAGYEATVLNLEQNLKRNTVDPLVASLTATAYGLADTVTNAAYGAVATAQAAVAAEQQALPGQEAGAIALANAEAAYAQGVATGTLATVLYTEQQAKQQYVDPTVATASALAASLQALATTTVNGLVAQVSGIVFGEVAAAPGQVASAQAQALAAAASAQNTANGYVATLTTLVNNTKTTYVDPLVATAMAQVAAAQSLAASTLVTAQNTVNNAPATANALIATALATEAAQQAAITLLVTQTKATYIDPQVAAAMGIAASALVTANGLATTALTTVNNAPATAAAAAATAVATALAAAAAGQAAANAAKATYVDPEIAVLLALAGTVQTLVTAQATQLQALVLATVAGAPATIAGVQQAAANQAAAVLAVVNSLKTGTVDPLMATAMAKIADIQAQATAAANGILSTVMSTAAQAQTTLTNAVNSAPGTVTALTVTALAAAASGVTGLVELAVQTEQQMIDAFQSLALTKPQRYYFQYPYLSNTFTVVGSGDVLHSEDGDTSYITAQIDSVYTPAGNNKLVSLSGNIPTDPSYKQPMSLVLYVSAKEGASYGTPHGTTMLHFNSVDGVARPDSPNYGVTVPVPNDGLYHRVVTPLPPFVVQSAITQTYELSIRGEENVAVQVTVKISSAYLEQQIPNFIPTPLNATVSMANSTGALTLFGSPGTPSPSGQANIVGSATVSVAANTYPTTGNVARLTGSANLSAVGSLTGGFFVYSTPINCLGSASESVIYLYAPSTGGAAVLTGSATLALGAPIVSGLARAALSAQGSLFCSASSTVGPSTTTLAIVGRAVLSATGYSTLLVPNTGAAVLAGLATETVTGYSDMNVFVAGFATARATSSLTANGLYLSPVGTEGPLLIISAPDVVQTGSVVSVHLQAVDASGVRLAFVGPPSIRIYSIDTVGNERDLVPYTTTTQQGQSYLYTWQVTGLGPYIIEGSGTSTTLGNVVGVQTVLVQQNTTSSLGPSSLQGGLIG